MFDENLRRALMVSKGSFAPIFRIGERPVAFILFFVILYMIIGQIGPVKRAQDKMAAWLKKLIKRNDSDKADTV
jgi:TctA family transporter